MPLKSIVAALFALLFVQAAAAQPAEPAQSEPTESAAPAPPAAPAASAALPAPKAVPATLPALEAENTLYLDLTSGGRVAIQLRPDAAPQQVERIKTLVRQGFYNGLIFHRVIEGFMAQGGDPRGDGTGGSELPDVPAEFNTLPHVRGAVAAARSGDPNSANSQFYIMFMPRFSLDYKYTVFGRVVDGMQYVDAIQRGEPPANPTRIVQASIGSDNRPQPPASALQPAPIAPVAIPDAPSPLTTEGVQRPQQPQQGEGPQG